MASRAALIFSVAAMLSLTLLNIVLRWMGQSIMWIEPLVRHFVFLSAFLGGVLATGARSHIGIDILPRLLEARGYKGAQHLVVRFVMLVSFLVCLTLVWAGISFSIQEFQYGKPGFLNIHSGYLVSIIPAGFFLIAIRFLLQTITYSTPSSD